MLGSQRIPQGNDKEPTGILLSFPKGNDRDPRVSQNRIAVILPVFAEKQP